MSEPKFTPGPWFTDDYGYIFSGERRDAHMIAEVRGWGWIQYLPDPEKIQDANAHLIAAAPELFEALEYVMTAHGEQLSDAFEKAQAALAKARGEDHD